MSQTLRRITVEQEFSAVSPALGRAAPQTEARALHLVGPVGDALLLGGFSVGAAAMFMAFVPKYADSSNVLSVVILGRFVLEMPHFMATYLMFYGDRRQDILASKRYRFFGVILPTILALYLGTALLSESRTMLEWAIHAMFFSVGHHYVKQFFGVILATSHRHGFIWAGWERAALRACLYPLWVVAFISHNHQIDQILYGFPYRTLNIPDTVKAANQWLIALTAALLGLVLMRQWLVQRRWSGGTSIVVLVALFVWMLPWTQHPLFLMMIPAFHSLQYLTVYFSVKQSEARQYVGSSRKVVQAQMIKLAAILLGASYLVLSVIPSTIDKLIAMNPEIFGTSVFLLCAMVFVNLHHYGLDHILWRRDHPQIRNHL